MAEAIRTEEVKSFLLSLETDYGTYQEYEKNPTMAMENRGLNPAEIGLLMEADSAAIKTALAAEDILLIVRVLMFSAGD